MIANELHFTNPMSLILAGSVSGTDLKRAKVIENEYFLNGDNHYNNQKKQYFQKVAEASQIDFDIIKPENRIFILKTVQE